MAREPTKTYFTVNELSKMYHRSPTTVNSYLAEIQSDSRYKDNMILIEDSRPKLVNVNIFEDYLFNRTYLRNRNLRKHLDPFDPVKVARQRGESQGNIIEVIKPDKAEIMEAVKAILREGLGA
jgi:hypothetical protein